MKKMNNALELKGLLLLHLDLLSIKIVLHLRPPKLQLKRSYKWTPHILLLAIRISNPRSRATIQTNEAWDPLPLSFRTRFPSLFSPSKPNLSSLSPVAADEDGTTWLPRRSTLSRLPTWTLRIVHVSSGTLFWKKKVQTHIWTL